ncbi:16S rRNA (cytosine(1402)-N(4))-methyltransferase RsmH [Pseudoclavibacter chungangensis]|uniref:Ribosomal RNA small subunit methyltransferase H n=1 Tax=Pseudoclavibacter chungangensis TaxID=587635 RepID=A0A7J5C243_9MICO|nr:16S rRNA (cytosine(1402)-N(4))-methyltransferase RsmH [Pseudoclavibacter chungangensis]KAB1660101.1 16S rRNA (cytosine(1402)-N(4))-methyltransferase RsmH [Pseudoclavibacter chungangensis]NYJ66795.1 16S rRNA (cytosine1402-N4)-methyltransferase [Pseudoclavibacter chungangensis]
MDDSRDPAALHTPVMLRRCVELLAPALDREGAVYVDATLGMGGHAEAVLTACPTARLVGIDRDTDALELAGRRLARFGDRVTLVHAVYDRFAESLDELGLREVDAVLFDLGVSSLQLDEPERGFSYARDAPLDMRMDRTRGVTAEDVVNDYDETALRELFYRCGDEKLAPRYASRIVRERADERITTTGRLVEILQAATPAAKRDAGHPAKRVFQALRVEVNGELAALERALPQALDRVRVDGRIVVESYQSLEDRFVKRLFAEASTSTAPRGLPVELPEHRPQFELLVRGAERPPLDESETNPRALPVRLRAARRIRRNDA